MQDITYILESKAYFGGTIPLEESIALGQDLGFLLLTNGNIKISENVITNLLPICISDTPNLEVIRRIIYGILTTNRFQWISYFNEDPGIFMSAIPNIWIETLSSFSLFEFNDPEIIEWWSTVLAAIDEINSNRLKEIGDIGELLTLQFEKRRLQKDGFSRPEFYVKWKSRFENDAGYDIASLRGSLLRQGHSEDESISIEVKASVTENTEKFRFKVSRNEYETAIQNADNYYYYLWTGINLHQKSFKLGPFIVPATHLVINFPVDNSENCRWTECLFTMDLQAESSKNVILQGTTI